MLPGGTMVKSCCVLKCTNRGYKEKNISYFRFPVNKRKRNAWVKAINRENWQPNVHSHICSEHFVDGWHGDEPTDPNYRPTIFKYKTALPTATAVARQESAIEIDEPKILIMGRRRKKSYLQKTKESRIRMRLWRMAEKESSTRNLEANKRNDQISQQNMTEIGYLDTKPEVKKRIMERTKRRMAATDSLSTKLEAEQQISKKTQLALFRAVDVFDAIYELPGKTVYQNIRNGFSGENVVPTIEIKKEPLDNDTAEESLESDESSEESLEFYLLTNKKAMHTITERTAEHSTQTKKCVIKDTSEENCEHTMFIKQEPISDFPEENVNPAMQKEEPTVSYNMGESQQHTISMNEVAINGFSEENVEHTLVIKEAKGSAMTEWLSLGS